MTTATEIQEMQTFYEQVQAKWAPILDHESMAKIGDARRRSATAVMLENTQRELGVSASHAGFQTLTETSSTLPVNFMGASSSTAGAGGIDTFDPVLISLVRRAMPNLVAYDVCGVQPMTGPTGLIFAMRSRYSNQTGGETFYNEVNTAFGTVVSGANTFGQQMVGGAGIPGASNTSALTAVNTYNTGSGMSTAQAEALGADSNVAFPQMAFTIEKDTVTAQTRAMKAEYTMELAQDLKAIHGLDAETELSNILAAEILAEINREVVRTINITSVVGAQQNVTTAGVFDLDTDSNGRWSVEKFKGLMFQLERECNQIAKTTRRGKGNIVICSSDVASALQMAGVLDYTPALDKNNLQVDDTGNTFAGVLNGRLKVYIDPYAIGGNYVTLGYKGSSVFDAGLFYCPYVPLQMVRAVDQSTFQPKIGFKTRYGMIANPFAQGLTVGNGALTINTNYYYRKVIVNNLM
ncbi:MAG: ATP-binding protein [Candidatus Paceibacteria bacterium]